MSVRIHSFFVCDLCGILEAERVETSKHCPSYELGENTALLKHATSLSSPVTSTQSSSRPSFMAERPPRNVAWRGEGRGEGSIAVQKGFVSAREEKGHHATAELPSGCQFECWLRPPLCSSVGVFPVRDWACTGGRRHSAQGAWPPGQSKTNGHAATVLTTRTAFHC